MTARHPDPTGMPELRILSPDPTPAEVAAVTAVLARALDDLAAETERDSGSRMSAWQRSQRPVRGAITPGAGAWRSFSA